MLYSIKFNTALCTYSRGERHSPMFVLFALLGACTLFCTHHVQCNDVSLRIFFTCDIYHKFFTNFPTTPEVVYMYYIVHWRNLCNANEIIKSYSVFPLLPGQAERKQKKKESKHAPLKIWAKSLRTAEELIISVILI